MKLRERAESLADANVKALASVKGQKGISKRVTTFKAADDGESSTGGFDSSPMQPNDEQLERINKFTRSPKKATDLVVFSTLSCNDLFDRDDEAFTTDTVKDFAKLPEPYGPVGKAYMVSHDYTKLPVGRIFGAGTKQLAIDGVTDKAKATFLTNEVYIPNTLGNQKMIEDIDFGVNWAVSVGVMLDKMTCSLSWCGADMRGMGRWAWCAEGHDKGYWYTPDAEKDSWGYYVPVVEGTKGAEFTRVYMEGAKDFFELSQCFLGAQFFAALEEQKGVSARNIIKAASAHNIPIIGLTAKETDDIFSPALIDARVRDAVQRFGAKPDDDGLVSWVDDQKLVWQFDPESSESGVMCLGKSSEGDGDGSATGQPDEGALGEDDGLSSDDGQESSADERLGEGSEDGGIGTGDEQEVEGQDGSVDDSDSDDGSNNDDGGKEATVSKAAIVKALKGLGNVPEAVLREVENAEGDALDAALRPLIDKITSQDDKITTLTPRAALGDKYIETKRAEAIDWYVKANQAKPNEPVNTDTFTKLLEHCGDNVDLIEELCKTNKQTAQARFPTSVRRTSFDADPNNPGGANDDEDNGDQAVSGGGKTTVSRIHG